MHRSGRRAAFASTSTHTPVLGRGTAPITKVLFPSPPPSPRPHPSTHPPTPCAEQACYEVVCPDLSPCCLKHVQARRIIEEEGGQLGRYGQVVGREDKAPEDRECDPPGGLPFDLWTTDVVDR